MSTERAEVLDGGALCSSSLTCFVATIATSGIVHRTVQPMVTTSQALKGYPALITSVVVGVHVRVREAGTFQLQSNYVWS
jgi:hypothetical protein